MDYKLSAICLLLAILSCTALKCHEGRLRYRVWLSVTFLDSLEANDPNYYLNECSPDTTFCATLSNSKTTEVFR
jgi:hypothetical protein